MLIRQEYRAKLSAYEEARQSYHKPVATGKPQTQKHPVSLDVPAKLLLSVSPLLLLGLYSHFLADLNNEGAAPGNNDHTSHQHPGMFRSSSVPTHCMLAGALPSNTCHASPLWGKHVI